MNKTYRLIWNRCLGAWVAAAETTCASGKKSSGRARAGVAAAGFAAALGASLPLAAAAADLAPGALPTGGTVAAGQADIAASGTRMDITQSSQKAIINWQGFDIGSQAQVNFAQPNAAAVALNRVSGPNISRIEGQLTANGQVFLVNPSGVIFGNGARVNAGAFVASTLNIRDDDFLAGNYTFTGTGGTIENRGTISAAPGGYVAFIAPKITNAGIVSAPQGTVAMGAGERVTLNFAGDRLVGLSVAAETLDTLIENRQAIRAEGGAILLTAAGAEAVTRGVINNSGVLEAGSLTADGGRIVLTAGNDVNLASTSTVAVDGQKGGRNHRPGQGRHPAHRRQPLGARRQRNGWNGKTARQSGRPRQRRAGRLLGHDGRRYCAGRRRLSGRQCRSRQCTGDLCCAGCDDQGQRAATG